MCTYLNWTCVVFSVYNTVISSGHTTTFLCKSCPCSDFLILGIIYVSHWIFYVSVDDIQSVGKRSFVVGVEQRRFSFHLLFVPHFHHIYLWISTRKEIEKKDVKQKQWIVRQKKGEENNEGKKRRIQFSFMFWWIKNSIHWVGGKWVCLIEK